MSTKGPGLSLALPVICPDGTIYSIASVDGKTIRRNTSTYNAILRYDGGRSFYVIGYHISIDTKTAVCHPETNDIYFTHYYGGYKLIAPKD